jgi:hypothetical protein
MIKNVTQFWRLARRYIRWFISPWLVWSTLKHSVEFALSAESLKILKSQTGGLWLATAALAFLVLGTILAGIAPDIGAH